MMRLPVFRLHRPDTLDQAIEAIQAAEGPTRVVAGGTDLWPNMKRRHQAADDVVSLSGVSELKGVRGEVGALTSRCKSPISMPRRSASLSKLA